MGASARHQRWISYDSTSDPIWWSTFLLGGMLLGGVAWLARVPRSGSA